MSLDTSRTEAGYVTGRLFAVLEQIQRDSVDGDLNATIKDRYFGAASATPSVVFPRLIRLSQHHMEKLPTTPEEAVRRRSRMKQTYERLLGEILGKMNSFANNLNLEDQGLFAIGYFHQRQDLFTSRKNGKEGDSK